MDPLAPIKALADETRLRLFAVLSSYELNVNELTALFGMGQSRISRHLRILSDAGLVAVRRQGQWSFYRGQASRSRASRLASGMMELLGDWPVLADDLGRASALIANRNSESRRFFADVSGKRWSALKLELDGGADLDGQVIDWLEERETVADIGCGMGDLLLRLAGLCRHVIGVDHAPAMLEQLRVRVLEEKRAIDLRIGDVSHLPLGDGEADALVLNMVLHHLPQPGTVFHELARVTRNGGQLLLAELDVHSRESVARQFGDVWMGFSQSDLRDWLEQAGWEIDRKQNQNIGLGLKAHLISARKKKNKEVFA